VPAVLARPAQLSPIMRTDIASAGNFLFVGRFTAMRTYASRTRVALEASMNGLIYLIGLIVVIMFILSLLGLR
jgi:hypothetical protein